MKQCENTILDPSAEIADDPSSGDAFAGKGMAFYPIGNIQPALADFEKACSLESDAGCRSVKALSKKQ